MKKFEYTALDGSGKIKSGQVEAADDIQAANILRERDLIITSLKEKEEFDFFRYLSRFQRVPDTEKVMFARQMATMIVAGLPLSKALAVLEEQSRNKRMKLAINEMIRDIDGGLSLSQALEKHREIFSDIFINLVKAGEASGNIDKILLRLADTLENQHRFSSQVKGAMIYPIIVLVFMIGVMVIMFIFVIPKLTDMFTQMGADLPLPTKILIAISTWSSNNILFVILGVIAFSVGINRIGKTPKGQYFFADRALTLPIFGKIVKQVQFANLARTLSLLIGSGLPILQALEISRETVSNLRVKEGIAKAAKSVEKGSALSEPLKNNPIFPIMLSQMIAIGEETGKIDEVLQKVASFFEEEASDATKNISTAMEPLIMVVLGLGVAFLIISIVLPIYKLTTSF